jgi:hypothetical protein
VGFLPLIVHLFRIGRGGRTSSEYMPGAESGYHDLDILLEILYDRAAMRKDPGQTAEGFHYTGGRDGLNAGPIGPDSFYREEVVRTPRA